MDRSVLRKAAELHPRLCITGVGCRTPAQAPGPVGTGPGACRYGPRGLSVWAPGPVGVGSGACVHRFVKIGLYGWPVGQTNALVHHIVIALLLTPLTMRGSIRRTVP
jgi:hypothetical protein